MRKYALAAALAVFSSAIHAAPLILSDIADPSFRVGGPQSNVTTCIIAGTNCGSQIDGFGFNNFQQSGQINVYDMYSTTPTDEVANGVQGTPYTAAQIVAAVGGVRFDIGIDVNTTNAASETLLSFEVIDVTLGNLVLYSFTGIDGSKNIGGNVNGNGFADYQLTNVNLANGLVEADHQILFRATWNGAVDGAESFFLFNGTGGGVINPQCPVGGCPVPGPVVGAGIPGLIVACGVLIGLARRRRQAAA